MLAPFGDMLTPLTTIHALALELGYNDDEIKERLNRIFDLKDFDYLSQDPLLGIKGATSLDQEAIQGNLAAYTSHIELMVGLNIFARTLKKSFHDAENNNQHDTELLRSFTKALFDNTSEKNNNDTPIRDALRNAISNMHPDASADDTAYLNAIASFAATASTEVGARLKQLTQEHKTDALNGKPAVFLAALHKLKTEILTTYNKNTERLSEGLYHISNAGQRRSSLASRLEASHGDFIQLTRQSLTTAPTREQSTTTTAAATTTNAVALNPKPGAASTQQVSAEIKQALINKLDLKGETNIFQAGANVVAETEKFQLKLGPEDISSVKLATLSDGTQSLNAIQNLSGIEFMAKKANLQLHGEKIKSSTFTFSRGNGGANLVSTPKLIKNVTFNMQGNTPDKVIFEDGKLKHSIINTGAGSDDILIGSDTTGTRKTTFNLGTGKDLLTIEGRIRNSLVDLGDDKKKDIINITNLSHVKKLLTIDNFGKRDKLIIDGDTYKATDIRQLDSRVGKIIVNFQSDPMLGLNTTSASSLTGNEKSNPLVKNILPLANQSDFDFL